LIDPNPTTLEKARSTYILTEETLVYEDEIYASTDHSNKIIDFVETFFMNRQYVCSRWLFL